LAPNFRLKISRKVRSFLLCSTAALLPVLSVAASGQNQQPLFPTTGFYSPGSAVLGMTSGDFNGDGQPDLAFDSLPFESQTPTFTTVTVLLNQGATTPPIPVVTTSLTCTSQGPLVAADMNNDKKLDLVISCTDYVVVLLGNGDGSFQAPSYYAVSGSGPLAPPIDLNGDGYLDVIVLNSVPGTSSNVNVLLNQGSSGPGLLSTPKSYPSPEAPGTIGTGDFNGDGKQDILVGNGGFAVFYGNGDGTLQTPQTLPIAQNTVGNGAFVASDFNQDGITDVAYLAFTSPNVSPGSLEILLGSSSGQFTSSNSPLTLPGVSGGSLVSIGTSTGSTNVNLAVVNQNTTILLGDGQGGFSLGQSYAISGFVVPTPGSNGKTDLVFNSSDGLGILTSNGDGTFQGLPTLPVGAGGFISADVNGDGLTDILYQDDQNNLVTALGRGNGTFSISSQNSSATTAILATGDFNEDGNLDAASILVGHGQGHGQTTVQDSQLFLYKGNGDGTFQASTTGIDLQVNGAEGVIVGDFNGDGHLDVVVSYSNQFVNPPPSSGLVFIAGKGDGTFDTPVPFSQGSAGSQGLLLSADLNNDKKLDFIWGNAIYLGNGDGTFKQSPLGLADNPLAVGDLNGDGIADLVIGASVYAGNGDGTFQTTPFYNVSTLLPASVLAALIGDVNGDGHADLLLQSSSTVAVFLGDGQGNFTADTNTYYTGDAPGPYFTVTGSPVAALARLNHQAPSLATDHALDYLVFSNGGATSLINQTNAKPTTPSPLPSKTVLAVSANSAVPNQQLTFTATVTGINPTGSVSFVSGSTTLGTATVTNGTASLSASFAAVGTYPVTAAYAGDSNNLASVSSVVSISIAAAASKTTLAISAGSANQNQQLSLTATVTGANPTGSVSFVSGSTTLGAASITNGTATLPFSFTAAGTYIVTANYAGDVANLASTSNAVSVTVVAPDFTVSASPSTATIKAGQSATTTLTVMPVGGYSGAVKFSCGTLPSGATCTFAPASVTPANGAAATTTLTVSTTAPSAAMLRTVGGSLQGIALASIFCLAFSPKRTLRINRWLIRSSLLLLISGLISLSGCSSSSAASSGTTNSGTPTGAQTITVSVTDSSGGPSHSINFQVIVQ
jgi:hypothetical protein